MTDDPDWIARALGALGAVSGTVGAVVAVLAYRRGRPKLEITWRAQLSVPHLEVTVVNVGGRPVALAGVSVQERRLPLRAHVWRWIGPFRHPLRRLRPTFGSVGVLPQDEIESPVMLGPGEPYLVRFEAGGLAAFWSALGEDATLWLVASDVLGREVNERLHPDALYNLEIAARGH